MPKTQSQDNWCKRVKAARTNYCFNFQLQTEWKPKHCWWKLPNTLFRNSSAHVLWFFFLFKWSRLWNYPHFESAYHHSTWALYKKKKKQLSGMTEKIYHSRTYWSPVAYSSFQVYLPTEDEEKSNRWTPEKDHLFQARFRSETKRTLRDPTSHEEPSSYF